MIMLFDYFVDNINQIFGLLIEHVKMTAIAVLFAVAIGVPLGILISYVKNLGKPIIGVANVVQAIPSLALLGLAIPLLGIGELPAIVMVIIYSLLPIIKNTYTGISSIDPHLTEAAKGIGLSKWQILSRVKIPMALPVVMAGVRISAVTAVGLMTMAAFIGAGGLGYMVFSGIRTVNNYQILAGAIPACLLALLVDYMMGIVENLVTPISFQQSGGKSKKDILRGKFKGKVILGVAILIIVTIIGNSIYGTLNKSNKSITFGGKDFTEQMILCNMYADVIEHDTDIDVVRKENLGGTQVCYEAMKKGEIDAYVDYTGTLYVNLLGHESKSDMTAIYKECSDELKKKYNFTLMKQANFNNTYTLAGKQEVLDKFGIKTLADLANVPNQVRAGTTLEFQNREGDGLSGLMDRYGIKFSEIVGIDGSPRFSALINGKTDLVDAYATDGMLKKYKLTVLKDEDGFFPPYYAVPMIRGDVLEKYPELRKPIDRLSPLLTDEVMQDLNYQVDELGKEPRNVAREFLKKKGLI